ncbi:hypothetical protein CRUP_000073 [Coryphaenoides rupestris]|nr:hypothetical protein CRUP_000073 [Coryphaenoides rupestris]
MEPGDCSLASITDTIIRKYGTHFLLSATLGGEESLMIFVDKRRLSKMAAEAAPDANGTAITLEALHQLAASYFIDRESTLRKLHHIQIASTAIKEPSGDPGQASVPLEDEHQNLADAEEMADVLFVREFISLIALFLDHS